MLSERQLLKGARAFDPQILAKIYDQYSPALYRYAVRLLNDSDQAEDCVAETFSRFLHALKRGGGPREHLQAYLYRIAHNWVTDQYRSHAILPLAPDVTKEPEPASDPNPQLSTDDVLQREQVRRALMQLTPEQQQVIVLKYIEGWSNPEVARSMKKTVGSIKSLQHRALETLNNLLSNLNE